MIGSADTFSLAFGTSTSNTWGGTQTFGALTVTGATTLATSLSGLLGLNAGVTYAVSTSSMNASISGSAGSVAESVTFAVSGGAPPNATFNGSSAITVSYSTVGAQVAGSYESPLTFNPPLSRSSNTISWTGLATTSQPSSSNLFVSDGTNGIYGVATTSISISAAGASGLTTGGTWGALVGGTSPTLSVATSSLYTGAANALPYFSSTNTFGSIAAGTNGQVLTMSGGTPTWIATTSIQNLTATYPLSISGTSISTNFSTTTNTGIGSNLVLYTNNSGVMQGVSTSTIGTFFGSQSAGILGTAATGNLSMLATSTLFGSTATFLTTGNVGIGTTSPYALLSVGGNVVIGAATAGGTLGNLTLPALAASAGSFLAVNASGQVIATTSPISSISANYPLTGNGTAGTPLALAFGTTTSNTWGGTQTFTNPTEFTSGWLTNGGITLAYASSTNQDTIFGLGAGGQNATTSASVVGNVAIGYKTMNALTSGSDNVGLGYEALLNASTDQYDTAIGYLAMGVGVATGNNNNAIGQAALANLTSGAYNNALGFDALTSASTANFNNAIGYQAMGGAAVTGNGYNNAIGYNTLFKITSGQYNDVSGYQSGYNLTTGSENILISTATTSTSVANLTSGSRNILIGSNISLPSATANGQLDIGNVIYGTGLFGSGSTLPNALIGIGTSSPYANLSIMSGGDYGSHAASTVFAIGSSTAGTATSTLMTVLSSGYVGIGTSAPLNALDVVGGVAVGSYAGTNAAPSNGMIISGNVGIGTTSPYSLFSLQATAGGTTPLFTIASSTNGAATSTALTILANGNVGINTSSPTSQLTIIGSTPSTAVLGTTIVTDGTFTAMSNWGSPANWASSASCGGQAASCAVHSNGSTAALTQNLSDTANTTYQVVIYSSATGVTASLGAYFTTALAAGTTTTSFEATTTETDTLTFTPTSATTAFITNLSIQPIQGTTNPSVYFGLQNSNATAGIEIRSGGSSLYNTFIGYQSGIVNTTGSYGTSLGYLALNSNITGSYNTAVGYESLFHNTTGTYNTANGYASLYSNTTGGSNTANGYCFPLRQHHRW